jgi:hypothetical protein
VSHARKTTDYKCIRKNGVTVKYHGGYEWQITSSAIFELLESVDIGQLCVLPQYVANLYYV